MRSEIINMALENCKISYRICVVRILGSGQEIVENRCAIAPNNSTEMFKDTVNSTIIYRNKVKSLFIELDVFQDRKWSYFLCYLPNVENATTKKDVEYFPALTK